MEDANLFVWRGPVRLDLARAVFGDVSADLKVIFARRCAAVKFNNDVEALADADEDLLGRVGLNEHKVDLNHLYYMAVDGHDKGRPEGCVNELQQEPGCVGRLPADVDRVRRRYEFGVDDWLACECVHFADSIEQDAWT